VAAYLDRDPIVVGAVPEQDRHREFIGPVDVVDLVEIDAGA
jgi:hypothetical protein